MSRVELGAIAYIGIDANEEHIATARMKEPGRDVRFLNILADELPKADAILSRDFLQHLPTRDALKAIERFAASKAKWLVATSFYVADNLDIERPGMFRPLNLQIAPFSLGEPLHRLQDPPGTNRTLGAWRLN